MAVFSLLTLVTLPWCFILKGDFDCLQYVILLKQVRVMEFPVPGRLRGALQGALGVPGRPSQAPRPLCATQTQMFRVKIQLGFILSSAWMSLFDILLSVSISSLMFIIWQSFLFKV